MLTPLEFFWLHWHSAHSPEPFAQYARVVLSADFGASPTAIAETLGSSEADVARVLEDYAANHLGDFPRPSLSLEDLLNATRADLTHARLVVQLAVALFNATRSLHRLPATLRPVLEASAWLHDVGFRLDEAQHHLAGRDLLRGMELVGYTQPQQAIIACAISFHRKKVKPLEEDLFTALSTAQRRQTLGIAALLRLADGLAQSGVSQLARVVITPTAITLHLTALEPTSAAPQPDGRHSAKTQMLKKADLWEAVYHFPIQTVVKTTPPDIARWATLPLTSGTPVSRVAQRALAASLQRWQANLASALAGDEIALESIRGAAASLRAALRLFGHCFDQRAARKLRKGLKDIEQTLKEAQRARFALADAEGQLAKSSKEVGAAYLLTSWKKQRAAAMAQAQARLSGTGAADLLAAITTLMAAEPEGGNEPLYRGLGQIVEAVVAEIAEREIALPLEKPKAYTRLYRSVQRCRCALEFFAPALSEESAPALIADLARVEARLEKLDDFRRVQQRLALFLDDWANQQAKRKAPQLHDVKSVLDYAHTRRAIWEANRHDLKPDLAPVRSARLRQRVSAIVQAAQAEPGELSDAGHVTPSAPTPCDFQKYAAQSGAKW